MLEQLRLKKFVATRGTYLKIPGLEPQENKELQKQAKGKKCVVCAVGSAFMSGVRLFDNFKLQGYHMGFNEVQIERSEMTKFLKGAFGVPELKRMETYFEYYSDSYGIPTGRLDSDVALTNIMQNIIANDGCFRSKRGKLVQDAN